MYTSDENRNGIKIYKAINEQLRSENLDNYNKELNELLNNALEKLPKYGENVYRGIYGNEAAIASQWEIGEKVIFKEFKSSSKNIQIAAYEFSYEKGSDVVIEIINSKGVDVCTISCKTDEMEVLLNSGQEFIVKDIKDNFKIYDKDFAQVNSFTKIMIELK